ncbi:tryptophan-tRNA ligase [Allomyces macrogynus ATCC 38327]|uniref:Tryptophan--tRNA ligase, mitochondrial n=1 Tax=Allomyces macrogynus (strain ATCC 38327) TaxID=578462 RepID=A0A0L0T929_ALLM3|nr:tryptophan-tRNA ligase [Allomyces macrogynus ATCC 38327]|eukprot:KNE71252.1 tryptophan-tRNA ligase [Allomyces macrogynus ATCC 38327]
MPTATRTVLSAAATAATTTTKSAASAAAAVAAPPVRRILSGIQPTGVPHLGNFLGALRQWVQLQDQPAQTVVYSIVDLHALTAHPPVPPATLRDSIHNSARVLLALGINPKKSILFQQSQVPAHTQLQWVLTCVTSVGWLNRMTQWKTKAGSSPADAAPPAALKMGLFAYPVLQAADILIYRATHVPVGEDQHQHLELARDIAKVFNTTYKTNLFPMPQAVSTSAKRIMSLTDPTAKMSKSHANPKSRIDLTDSDSTIAKKVRGAVTDSDPTVTWDPDTRPGVANLLSLYAACRDLDPASLPEGELKGVVGMVNLKKKVAECVVDTVRPVRDEYLRLGGEVGYVKAVLEEGNARARAEADATWEMVMKAVGMK